MDVGVSALSWFDHLLRSDPIHWDSQTSAWYVTRHSDVSSLLADPRLGQRASDAKRYSLAQQRLVAPLEAFLDRWPVFRQGPGHIKVRAAVEAGIATYAQPQIDSLISQYPFPRLSTEVDLVQQYIRPLTTQAAFELLGVASTDQYEVISCAQEIMAYLGMEVFDADLVIRANLALMKLQELSASTLGRRKGSLSEALANALSNGALDELDTVAAFTQVFTGMVEPTTSGATMAMVLAGAEGYDRLMSGAFFKLIGEAIRLSTPFHLAPRLALSDIELGGKTIKRGDRVVLVLVSANRDPALYHSEARTVGMHRRGHLAFGKGPHSCPGSALAHRLIGSMLHAFIHSEWMGRELNVEWDISFGMRLARSLRIF